MCRRRNRSGAKTNRSLQSVVQSNELPIFYYNLWKNKKNLYGGIISMRDIEHQIQVACVNYFRLRWRNALIFAIPNGGQRNIKVAQKLKAEGVLAGVPDLCVPIPKNGYNGLYIEMKAGKKGVVSDKQKDVMARLTENGYLCKVCRCFDDFQKVVDDYMGAKEMEQVIF